MDWQPNDVWLHLSQATLAENMAPFCRSSQVAYMPANGGGAYGTSMQWQVEFNLTAYIRHVMGPQSLNSF